MKVKKLSLNDFGAVGTEELLSTKGGLSYRGPQSFGLGGREDGGGGGGGGCGGPGWPINGDHFARSVQNLANDFGNSEVGQASQRGIDVAVGIANDFWEITKAVGNAASGFAFGRLGAGSHPKVLPLVPTGQQEEKCL